MRNKKLSKMFKVLLSPRLKWIAFIFSVLFMDIFFDIHIVNSMLVSGAFLFILVIGAFLNCFVMYHNEGKMPVYSHGLKMSGSKRHKIVGDYKKIKYSSLSDRFLFTWDFKNRTLVTIFSIGDILVTIGFFGSVLIT